MADFDENPFANPVDINPFADAPIAHVIPGRVAENIGEFNPFSATEMGTTTTIPVSAVSSQPAILQTSVEQSAQATATAGTANLLKQQEELERKAAELERKEPGAEGP